MADSTTYEPRLVDTHIPDGSTSSLRVFPPFLNDATPASSADAEKPLIVIWPGFGMGARYYDPIARELAERGYPVATAELRGQGSSTAVASKDKSWGYHHLASEDYPASIRAAKKGLGLSEQHPTVLLCHSMGGQIAALFMARPEAELLNVRGVMGVGAGTPFYKGFSGRTQLRLRYGTWLLRPSLKLRGYQADGKLDMLGYGRQAKDHIEEWHRYGQTNRLDNLAGQDMDYEERRKKITAPILLTRCINDEDCPMASAANLAVSLPAADVAVEEFSAPLGHNRWAREPQVVSDRLEEFIAAL